MVDRQGEGEISRAEVARRLSCSIAQVQRFEAKADLKPRRDVHGHVWFAVEEVNLLHQRWRRKRSTPRTAKRKRLIDGDTAAAVFECFEAALELPAIVIRLHVDPYLVRELYEQWRVSLLVGRERAHRERAAALAEASA